MVLSYDIAFGINDRSNLHQTVPVINKECLVKRALLGYTLDF